MVYAKPEAAKLKAFTSIVSPIELANFFGTSVKCLYFQLYSSKRPRYHTFQIQKSSGGARVIAVPPPLVLSFQRKLLSYISELTPPKKPCHGFSRGRSVVTNAETHLDSQVILNLDLEDFFPSIHFGRVRGMFCKRPFGFPLPIASMLAQLCCFQQKLPQGAPTSPIVANLICRGLDRDLDRLAHRCGCRYSRYADDLSFSTRQHQLPPPILGSTKPVELGEELMKIIATHDFMVNLSKVHLRQSHERQEVTGLVVNTKVNVRREYVHNLRAAIHDIEVNGVVAADRSFREIFDDKQRKRMSPSLNRHLKGKLAYLKMVKGSDDPVYVRYALRAHALISLRRFGVVVWGRSARPAHVSFLRESLWIVRAKDADGDVMFTGTAFTLDGVGIVSCSHNFDSEQDDLKIGSWELIRASVPTDVFPVTGIRALTGLDLAIVESPVTYRGALTRAVDSPSIGDPIFVVGYPLWKTLAEDLSVVPTVLSQIKTISAVGYLLAGANIYSGNSGGPLLDSNGKVIGVVAYGSSAVAAPNGSIKIEHVDALGGVPATPLS
ncbi:MAG: reverse transcriptase domain-containing protein [Gammaproteobacteria bacterium]